MNTALLDMELMTVSFSDWDHTRSVSLDLPGEASIAEAIDEASRELDLPRDVAYQALHRDRQLPGLSTLRDAGLESDSQIELMPDVKAG